MYLRLAGCLCGLLLLAPAAAHQVAGVVLPPHLTVAGTPLVLNGAGVRRHFMFKVYVGALYLEDRAATPDAILEAPTPKCIYLHFLRDVPADRIAQALMKGLRANVGEAAVARMQSRIERLHAAIPDLRAGDRVRLAFPEPDRTQAWVNDVLVTDVAGRDFQRAVLSFWLGEHPTDEHLKQALLGMDSAPQVAGDPWPEVGRP